MKSQCNTQESQKHTEMSNVDFVSSNENYSHKELRRTFLKTAKLWSRWSLKGRSPTLRHASRTNRVALDWLFDRTNLDHNLQQSRYVDSKNQLADLLTTGHFTRDECCGCSLRNLVTIRRTWSSTVPSSTASSSLEWDFKESAERSGAQNKETSIIGEMGDSQVRYEDENSMTRADVPVELGSDQTMNSEEGYGETRNREIIELNHWNRIEGNKRMQYSFCGVNLIQEQIEWESASDAESFKWIGKSRKPFSHMEIVCDLFNACSDLSWKRLLRESALRQKYRKETKYTDVVRCDSKIRSRSKIGGIGSVRIELANSYMGEAGLGGRRRGDQAHEGGKFTYSQILYCALEEYTNSPNPMQNENVEFRGLKDTYQCRELDGIHGEPVEFEWKKRISVKESLAHFRISDKSVFQWSSTFACFKHCKIQPIINLLLILEPRSWPIKEWWHFRSNSTCRCPLICWFRAICTNQRFGLFSGILC